MTPDGQYERFDKVEFVGNPRPYYYRFGARALALPEKGKVYSVETGRIGDVLISGLKRKYYRTTIFIPITNTDLKFVSDGREDRLLHKAKEHVTSVLYALGYPLKEVTRIREYLAQAKNSIEQVPFDLRLSVVHILQRDHPLEHRVLTEGIECVWAHTQEVVDGK